MDQKLSKFILARWCYACGEPIISDAEYTQLLNYIQATDPQNEYLKRSWSSDPCPVELLKQNNMERYIQNIVLSDKTESIPSINTVLQLREELQFFMGDGTVSMKHDGWNIQINYYNGSIVNIQTRGRTRDSWDLTKIQSIFPQTIPVKDAVKVVCELTVSYRNFTFCASTWGNKSPRSAVSTVLSKPGYEHLLSFHAFDIHGYKDPEHNKFEVLQSWGFPVPMYHCIHDYNEFMMAFRELSDCKPTYEWPTDGAVFDGDKRRAIRLLAWEEPIYNSFITGYVEQFGPYRISPSVCIYPIFREGTEQTRINVTNWQRIFEYDLQPGAPIAFRIASGAIADMDSESTLLLHRTWEGRWDVYSQRIKDDEEAKRLSWRMNML